MTDTWPTSKDTGDTWNINFGRFCGILNSVQDVRWWIVDFDLKYLEIRLDTRDNGFLLFIDKEYGKKERERVDPQRVVDAIQRFKEKYTAQGRAQARTELEGRTDDT